MAQRKATKAAARPWVMALLVSSKVEQISTDRYRLVETLNHLAVASNERPPPDEMPPARIDMDVFVQLATGPARGRKRIRVALVTPDGDREVLQESIKDFTAEDQVLSAIVGGVFMMGLPGLYWFEVWCGDDLLTRSPWVLIYDPSLPPKADADRDARPKVKRRVN